MRGTVAKRLRAQARKEADLEAGKIGLLGRIVKQIKDLKGNLHPRITAYYPKDPFRRIYRKPKKAHRQAKKAL